MRGMIVDVEPVPLPFFFCVPIHFSLKFSSFSWPIFIISYVFFFSHLIFLCLPFAAYMGSALRGGYCHDPVHSHRAQTFPMVYIV